MEPPLISVKAHGIFVIFNFSSNVLIITPFNSMENFCIPSVKIEYHFANGPLSALYGDSLISVLSKDLYASNNAFWNLEMLWLWSLTFGGGAIFYHLIQPYPKL